MICRQTNFAVGQVADTSLLADRINLAVLKVRSMPADVSGIINQV